MRFDDQKMGKLQSSENWWNWWTMEMLISHGLNGETAIADSVSELPLT